MFGKKLSIFKGMKHIFDNLEIRNKITVLFIISMTVSFLLLGSSMFIISSDMMKAEVSNSNLQTLREVDKCISLIMKEIDDISMLIALNPVVQNYLSKNYPSMTEEEYRDYYEVLEILDGVSAYNRLLFIKLYTKGKNYYSRVGNSYRTADIYSEDDIISSPWYNNVCQLNGKMLLVFNEQFGAQDDSILFMRRVIKNMDNNKLGIIEINVPNSLFENAINDIKIKRTGFIFIANTEGIILTHKNKEKIGEKLDSSMLQYIMENGSGYYINTVDGVKQMFIFSQNPAFGFIFIGEVPLNEVLENTITIRNYTVIILLICIILSIFISYAMSLRITKPIHYLTHTMRKALTGDFNIKVQINSTDEIGELSNVFNSLLQKINSLIHEVYESNLKKRELELLALQSQINPHFLYNTLDSLKWMAEKYKADDISEFIDKLALFFRLSVSRGKNIIALKDEIMQTKSYLQIQKIRYPDKLQVYFNLDPKTYEFSTVKLILQPIVENAIIHGIAPKKTRGTIIISSYIEDSTIILKVIDDGVGIHPERLKSILSSHSENKKKSYGMKNVEKRIQLYFGEKYTVDCYSRLGIGTVVTLRLPLKPLS